MEEILKIFSVIGISSLRHTFVGVPLASFYGYSLLEVIIFSAIGGIGGMTVFMLLTSTIKTWYRIIFPKKAKRKFTKMNRFIVKVRQRFGLIGLAFITPPILSIPLGTIVAASIYRNKRQVYLFLAVSILFWSCLSAIVSRPLSHVVQTTLLGG